jgi:transposase
MSDARFRSVIREQMSFRGDSLEQLLPLDHPVRAVWAMVCGWNLSLFDSSVKAVAGGAGAPAFDPRVLLTLWIQATLDGCGSARELAGWCESHLVYRWICGDDPVNYHTLADFRSTRESEIDDLLTQTVAAACAAEIATLTRVAQDGMKVRASAGTKSFRRAASLSEHLAEAQAQVAALKSRDGEDDGAASRRAKAARERAASERVARLTQAQEELAKLTAANARRAADSRTRAASVDPARLKASTTDPEARFMPMPGGGSRPAFNVQLATTTAGGIIVGVRVVNAGVDHGQAEPMVTHIETRTGQRPRDFLIDGGFTSRATVETLAKADVTAYAPLKDIPKAIAVGRDPFAARRRDPPEVAAWRARMGTDEAKTIYRLRGQTAEWVNAQCRNRGLQQFRLRGLKKVTLEVTWHALTHNVDRLRANGIVLGTPVDP